MSARKKRKRCVESTLNKGYKRQEATIGNTILVTLSPYMMEGPLGFIKFKHTSLSLYQTNEILLQVLLKVHLILYITNGPTIIKYLLPKF